MNLLQVLMDHVLPFTGVVSVCWCDEHAWITNLAQTADAMDLRQTISTWNSPAFIMVFVRPVVAHSVKHQMMYCQHAMPEAAANNSYHGRLLFEGHDFDTCLCGVCCLLALTIGDLVGARLLGPLLQCC